MSVCLSAPRPAASVFSSFAIYPVAMSKPRLHVSLSLVLQLPRQSVLQQVLLSLFPMLLSTCHLLSSTASRHGSPSLLSLLWTAKELLITDLSSLCVSSSFLSHSNQKDNPQKYESARNGGHLALGTLAQRNCIEFEANLPYRVRLTFKKNAKLIRFIFLLKKSHSGPSQRVQSKSQPLKKLRQEDLKFKPCLRYRMSLAWAIFSEIYHKVYKGKEM